MLETVPFVPLAGQVRIGVAIFSYDGALKFGVTGDYDSAPDIRVLCQGIEDGMAELVAAAERQRRPRRGTRAARASRARSPAA
jgi:diacylglycerol O-acyltransferase